MTAVVGILNKYGVAFAADSANTVSGLGKEKVYNSANKIFSLSKYHPVGISIHGFGAFMGVPWEVIIKEFRKELGKKHFQHLNDYVECFFNWLKEKEYFKDNCEPKHDIIEELLMFSYDAIRRIPKKTPHDIYLKSLDSVLQNFLLALQDGSFSKLPDDNIIEVEESIINEACQLIIEELEVRNFDKSELDNVRVLLKKCMEKAVQSNFFINYSGLGFFGYGESEIFPSSIAYKVSFAYKGKLRFFEDVDSKGVISKDNTASIVTFGQKEVINTLLLGASTHYYTYLNGAMESAMEQLVSQLVGIDGMPHGVINEIKTKISKNLYDSIKQKLFENEVLPMLNTVATLSKEDICEMAESLVYITYLKGRMSSELESVGKPIDVAFISKGDGFIWMKRKHYFNEVLNPRFNKNYFNDYDSAE